MDSWNLQSCKVDDLIIIKLCLKLGLLDTEQLRNALSKSIGKSLILTLSDNEMISRDEIAELSLWKEKSLLCPKCETLNVVEDGRREIECRECKNLISHTQSSKSTTSQRDRGSFGKYRIVKKVGEGSVGVVYKAIQTNLGRTVALKVLKPMEIDDVVLKRFQQEARAVASLSYHPHIVGLYDIEEDGRHFIVMEYIEGKALSEYIHNRSLALEEIVEITGKIADGLAHAHKHGIIHRDIKPDNILITPEKIPKITDFGLARQLSSDNRITQRNLIMGTPLYMSPEQASGSPNIGYQSDIYSLGVVLYEMLCGRTPFKNSPTLMLLQKIVSEPPAPLNKINPHVPPMLESICMKALAKKSSDRFHSAEEFRDALKKFSAKQKAVSEAAIDREEDSSEAGAAEENPSQLEKETPHPVASEDGSPQDPPPGNHKMVEITPRRPSFMKTLEQKRREQKEAIFDHPLIDIALWGGLVVLLGLLAYKIVG